MSTITNITLPPSPPPQAQSPLNHTPDQLCYVHCTRCDTVLAVSVPCTSLFKTVTVRCGHCTNLLPVNMRGLMLPSSPAVNQFHFGPSLFSPSTHAFQDDWITNGNSNFSMNQNYPKDVSISSSRGFDDLPKPPVIHRAPEKRQRVPSAYNRFIKEEIQRIKIRNPEISHREAFSAAAKNWAHFPHIHFGLMADHQTAAAVNRTSMRQQETDGGVMKENSPYRALLQENDGGVMKENLFAAANVGVSPYNY